MVVFSFGGGGLVVSRQAKGAAHVGQRPGHLAVKVGLLLLCGARVGAIGGRVGVARAAWLRIRHCCAFLIGLEVRSVLGAAGGAEVPGTTPPAAVVAADGPGLRDRAGRRVDQAANAATWA